MSYCSAIILAAGEGKRFKSRTPKPLAKLGLKPVLIYSLEILSRVNAIKEIILVVNRANKKAICAATKDYPIRKIVFGGVRRQDSVASGLKAVDLKADLVLIHDSARPFIDKALVSSLILEAGKTGASIPGVLVKSTVKRSDDKGYVRETLNRKNLWEVQTPQVFRRSLIDKAYQKFGKINATDCAMLVEKLKNKVKIIEGSYRNIKITTPEDLRIAKSLKGN